MIQIKNIKKSYQDFLLDCSLTIEKGSVTGIIGKNGAGKSTLYKAILNLINIDSGNILVFNKDIKELDVKDKADIGVVLADSFFSSYLNIKDIRKIMMDSYETFDVTFFDKKVNEFELPVNKAIKSFSFGMKAKLKMLCALSHNAKILLLDEPTLGLDVIARDEILELLREYMAKDSDNTIMISSHIASDLESLCDDIYMIDDGKIILHEDTDVLLSNYAILKVDDQTYESIDKNYIYKVKKEDYGYALLTNQKQFYYENYPKIVIQNCSIDDVIYKDFKNYVAGEYKIGIGQVFTTTFDDYEADISKYVDRLDEIAVNNDYKVVCLFVTDFINNNSYALFNRPAADILAEAYSLPSIEEGELLKGFVSRKKQIVPMILEILEKK